MFPLLPFISIGVIELIVAGAALLIGITILWLQGRRWPLGVAVCWTLSMLATPADPFSTLLAFLLCVAGGLTAMICRWPGKTATA